MEKESERKTHNTAYLPTKCRVTKPVPPKPATNPLQFVAVKPNPLLIKAQQQIKKVEVVKEARKEAKEEPEDWQSNLDNWKSSRRKRQEHIIERVEEVKKLELEDRERSRRRGTTFSEILEKRNKGRFSIPIYDNDSNDLSDYGIGSSSSKTNSIKDVDTDDNSSILDEKDNTFDDAVTTTTAVSKIAEASPHNTALQSHNVNLPAAQQKENGNECQPVVVSTAIATSAANEQYTYEGAIEDYRSRIRSKIHANEPAPAAVSIECINSKSKEFEEVQSLLPKGTLCERKKLFENNNAHETVTQKHLDDEFINAQSIKERLQSLEKCTEQPLCTRTEDVSAGNLKTRLHQFNNSVPCGDSDAKNNNNLLARSEITVVLQTPPTMDMANDAYETYFEKIKSVHMDALSYKSEQEDINGFPPTSASIDLIAASSSSDREDSGIHTADVSCSVSQSDEPVEDADVNGHDMPNYKTITDAFLNAEKEFADKTVAVIEHQPMLEPVAHSPLVEHIAQTIQGVPPPLAADNDKVFDYYENAKTPFTMDSINDIFVNGGSFKLKPPTEKPPPPPPLAGDKSDLNANSINPTMRIKKELLIKRSSFLGLEESAINEQLEQLEIQEKERESEQQQLHLQQEQILSAVVATNHEDDDEIMKKEREIIEMVEKEEQFKDTDVESKSTLLESKDLRNNSVHTSNEPTDIYLGNKKFDEPFYPEPCYDVLADQDSEVLKVEHELLQLEKEELKRQRDNLLFQERSAKLRESSNLYENLRYPRNVDIRKSMPDLNQVPVMERDPSYIFQPQPVQEKPHYQKSMPNIQQQYAHAQQKPPPFDYYNLAHHQHYDLGIPVNHRKSMPDLERSIKSAFTPTSSSSNSHLLMPIKPLMPIEKKDRYICQNPIESDAYTRQQSSRGMSRQMQPPAMLRSRSMPREPWIQPKANPQQKSYNQHWLYQEAELRRLADQQKAAALQHRQNQQQQQQHRMNDKSIMEAGRPLNEKNSPKRSVDPLAQKDYVNVPYMNKQHHHSSSYGHALPMSSYSQPMAVEEGQDVILSVSGKKKCSFCNKELGRGAAMIIESLSLFYHMECFKCCVCHMELGDGLMGTDVRVRNQKLHCHNCYSSDDGVKFSCV